MIALPIVGVSAADLTLRSAELSTTERLARSIGAADGRISDPNVGGIAIFQTPSGENFDTAKTLKDNEPYPEGEADVRKAAPQGARLLPDTSGRAKLETTHGLLNTEVRELKTTDPMTKGMLSLTEGRFPAQESEVAATTSFLKKSGLKVGGKLTARHLDREYRIVGAYELPSSLKTDQVNALPGALIKPLNEALKKADLQTDYGQTTYLVAVDGGFTWNMVKETNAKGALVESRAVAHDPPSDADVPLYQKPGSQFWKMDESMGVEELSVLATVVGLALLEICLLAGPAFAVGARRSRRQLGLVGANGGDRSHIRAIVLAGGVVIGAAAAVIGTALGVALSLALRGTFEEMLGERFGSFDARPLELLAIALLAVLTGTLAALVPAVTASRQSVLASLTGRRGIRRGSRVLPIIGLVAVVFGTTVALAGSLLFKSFVIVAGGAAVAELGVVALTPALVGLFGRLGRFLPLSPRLALRDAVRNRGRTAPAVAAVLAAVAGTVAVATYAASDEAQMKAQYTASAPHGSVSVQDESSSRDMPAIRDAVQRNIPADVRADVDRIIVGKNTCSVYSDEPGCGRITIVIPKENRCPLHSYNNYATDDPASKYSVAERRKLAKDWRCKSGDGAYVSDVVVADDKLLKVLGIKDAAAERALKSGGAVTFNKTHADSSGKVAIKVITDTKAAQKAQEEGKEEPGVVKSVPTHEVSGNPKAYGFQTVLSPAAAKAAGLKAVPYRGYFSTDRMTNSKEEQRLEDELSKISTNSGLHIEKGYESETSIVLVALAAFAGLITIGAAGIATGLSQADAEADLKTLTAVGAPPRVRRTLSGFQCGVVATMGVVLGSAAGMVPALGLILTDRREQQEWYENALDQGYEMSAPYVPIIMPWETLGALLIAVPLGATLLAALLTRSRGALARRETT
ncbi:FtsX-like permease family protein [Streptomyces sp. NPDC058953]|uniref:FtsX-like permease family protein n=1 Tax=unclassified Streptomyces TaxID=2593676 RepID=UPI0036C392ED